MADKNSVVQDLPFFVERFQALERGHAHFDLLVHIEERSVQVSLCSILSEATCQTRFSSYIHISP